MAEDAGSRIEVANLLSLGEDLVGVLVGIKDGEALAQACDGARMLRSACRSESGDLELQIKVYVVNTAVSDELDNLDRQRTSIEERKDSVKKKEKDMLKSKQNLCAILSFLSDIVDKNRKKLDKFEFGKTMSPVEICDKLWKMI
ncbi:unnamed protein product [Triticum turgidum subsp. durum]|uniref:Uncharacterized protein n=1 Tax=Triticum turgidum subsp. durum TaxID=4567 RepID=A0A9R1PRG7_TRITD|nr:unnamed protein product [Triticum turgidum subsp. durum]